jgi:hypothetical protein
VKGEKLKFKNVINFWILRNKLSTGTTAQLHKYSGILRVARNPFPLSISSLFHPCKQEKFSLKIFTMSQNSVVLMIITILTQPSRKIRGTRPFS